MERPESGLYVFDHVRYAYMWNACTMGELRVLNCIVH